MFGLRSGPFDPWLGRSGRTPAAMRGLNCVTGSRKSFPKKQPIYSGSQTVKCYGVKPAARRLKGGAAIKVAERRAVRYKPDEVTNLLHCHRRPANRDTEA